MSDPREEHDDLATVEIEQSEGQVVATVLGEVDISNADDIYRRLVGASSGAGTLTVNLSRLSFLDSAGIAGLDRLHQDLGGGPTRLQIQAGPGSVAARILALAGMDQVLPMTREASAG